MKKLLLSLILSCSSCFYAHAQDMGMTWRLIGPAAGVEATTGIVHVGCGYNSGIGNECNPIAGDTFCSAVLPVLCHYDAALPRPASVPAGTIYNRWSRGIVATTRPVAANTFAGIGAVDQFCMAEFGPDWRTAEFHDGWGWNFKAYGNIGSDVTAQRFWVDIDDQPDGTCW